MQPALCFSSRMTRVFTCHCSTTRMEQTLNKSWHRKLTLEKKILPLLLLGIKPATFQTWVRWSRVMTTVVNEQKWVVLSSCSHCMTGVDSGGWWCNFLGHQPYLQLVWVWFCSRHKCAQVFLAGYWAKHLGPMLPQSTQPLLNTQQLCRGSSHVIHRRCIQG